ncbi:MAG: nuclear transport factor 2 family protein, partial [Novosphingobium sp.]
MSQSLMDRLEAEAACTRLLHAYGRAIDWQDEAGLAQLFWPDAMIDLGFFTGSGTEAVGFLMANAATSERRFHATSNILLEINGDVALADSTCITHAVAAA